MIWTNGLLSEKIRELLDKIKTHCLVNARDGLFQFCSSRRLSIPLFRMACVIGVVFEYLVEALKEKDALSCSPVGTVVADVDAAMQECMITPASVDGVAGVRAGGNPGESGATDR